MTFVRDSDFQSIPLFDFKELETHRAESIGQLRSVCHNIGFFYIQNHGVSGSFMEKMLHLASAFFDLPQGEKEKVRISLSPHFRGYGRLQEEITEGKPDFKETYDFGLEQKARTPLPQMPFLTLQGPNQWPNSPRLVSLEWKEAVLRYLGEMQDLGKRLTRALSLSLGLEDSFFADQFKSDSEDAFALLRFLRYPSSRDSLNPEGPVYGVGPHIDSGCLVVLLQDAVGGLQVQNRKGEWIDAPPIPGTFVVNIGKMLQVWSNQYFLATPHRVLNSTSKTRHSIPFFVEPCLTTVVKPLELPFGLASGGNQESLPPEKPVVYGEYMLDVFKRSFPAEMRLGKESDR